MCLNFTIMSTKNKNVKVDEYFKGRNKPGVSALDPNSLRSGNIRFVRCVEFLKMRNMLKFWSDLLDIDKKKSNHLPLNYVLFLRVLCRVMPIHVY